MMEPRPVVRYVLALNRDLGRILSAIGATLAHRALLYSRREEQSLRVYPLQIRLNVRSHAGGGPRHRRDVDLAASGGKRYLIKYSARTDRRDRSGANVSPALVYSVGNVTGC
jgi:hypothetical protein